MISILRRTSTARLRPHGGWLDPSAPLPRPMGPQPQPVLPQGGNLLPAGRHSLPRRRHAAGACPARQAAVHRRRGAAHRRQRRDRRAPQAPLWRLPRRPARRQPARHRPPDPPHLRGEPVFRSAACPLDRRFRLAGDPAGLLRLAAAAAARRRGLDGATRRPPGPVPDRAMAGMARRASASSAPQTSPPWPACLRTARSPSAPGPPRRMRSCTGCWPILWTRRCRHGWPRKRAATPCLRPTRRACAR